MVLMTAADRLFAFEILDIKIGRLPGAETREFLQMSGDDIERIVARFNHPSRRQVA